MPKETSKTIAQWGADTFGEADNVKVFALRAKEELSELIDAIEQDEPRKDIALEAADVTILLHRLTSILGYELSELVDEKMAINRKREWTPSGNGVGQHR